MRAEAGSELILSGGIPATIFGPGASEQQFVDSIKRWLDLRRASSRLLLAAGDQVPPEAPWRRIAMLPDLVEKHGQY